MRILALCPPEFHDVAAAEARKLVGAKAEKSPLGIAFSCNETDVARYTYAARIPRRTLALLGTFAAAEELEKTLSSVSALLKDFEIADWCDARTFSVVCEREGRHAYSSQDVVSGLADLLRKIRKQPLLTRTQTSRCLLSSTGRVQRWVLTCAVLQQTSAIIVFLQRLLM